MSLYGDPQYFNEHLTDMKAPDEVSPLIEDLDPAFKAVLSQDNYAELTNLRKNKSEKVSKDMKISANQFANMIEAFGYKEEAQKVLTFLKGVGEYDMRSSGAP